MAKKEKAVSDAALEEVAAAPVVKKKVSGVTKEAKLTVLATENVKRAGSASFDRFEGYLKDPQPATVSEALDNGLTMGDIHYDIIGGSIEVEGASVEEYTPTPRGPRTAAEVTGTADTQEDPQF